MPHSLHKLRHLDFGFLSSFGFNLNPEVAVDISAGSTGHWPVPSGDSPLGTGNGSRLFRACFASANLLPVPSGQWPDGTGESPELPIPTSSLHRRLS